MRFSSSFLAFSSNFCRSFASFSCCLASLLAGDSFRFLALGAGALVVFVGVDGCVFFDVVSVVELG